MYIHLQKLYYFLMQIYVNDTASLVPLADNVLGKVFWEDQESYDRNIGRTCR